MATPEATAVAAAPVLGTPEYDAAMAAKYDERTATKAEPVVIPTRPEHIPEKFWDSEKGEVRTEALLKSYSELEKGKATKGVPPVADPAVVSKKPPTEGASPEAKAAVESVGLDFDAMSAEYAESGELSEDTYKSLEAKGIPKETVDAYIAGQQAVAAQWDAKGYEVAGGKEAFDKMAAWAATSLTAQEAKALNEAFSGKDTNEDKMKLAVSGLRAKYEAANGKAPGLLHGAPGSTSQGYESRAQMTADMKDPKYAKDPAFREAVVRKLAATTAF